MKKAIALGLVALALALVGQAWGQSTVNPNIPAQNSPLVSAPIRGNFTAAYNDIQRGFNMSATATQPSLLQYQWWANTASAPNALITLYDGTQPVTVGTLNTSSHTFSLGGSLFANPTASVGLSAVNGSATTAMRSDAAPALSQTISPTWTGNHTYNPTTGNAIAINPATPTANNVNRSIVSTQTGPPSFATGPLSYNSFTISNSASVTLPATLTTGMSNNQVHGVLFEVDDSSSSTLVSTLTAHYVETGPTQGDKIALHANSYSNQVSGSGYILGADIVAAVDTGSSGHTLASVQNECPMYGTSTTLYRMCVEITNSRNGVGEGGSFDSAIVIDNAGSSGGSFLHGISFGSPLDSAVPIAASGDAIYFHNHNPATITNFVNATNLTVTNDIFLFPNFSVQATNNQNGTTQVDLDNNNAGTSTFIQYRVNNGTNSATFGIGGTGVSNALYTGRAYVTGNGAALVVGTTTTQPTVFITGNAEVGRWDGSTAGQLDLGVAGTTVGVLSMRNATSGSINIQPQAGALGSSVLTAPATTATILTTSNASGTISSVTNSLGADVNLNASTYTDGPSVGQGTSGTWMATGDVTFTDTGVAPNVKCKLWDGTTIIDSRQVGGFGTANVIDSMHLSGVLASPAANIRISCIDSSGTTGVLKFNSSGNSKDSTLTAIRIN